MTDQPKDRPDERDLDQNRNLDPSQLNADWQAAWETEDNYWQENFSSRPYALGPDYYDQFRPAYRYGFESARDGLGRTWDEAEPDLESGWQRAREANGTPSTWDEIKTAVRDAWDRVAGGRTAESEARHPQSRE